MALLASEGEYIDQEKRRGPENPPLRNCTAEKYAQFQSIQVSVLYASMLSDIALWRSPTAALASTAAGSCWQVLRTRSLAPLRIWYAARRIARSGLFDRAWYLENNPDVAASGVNPIWHYLVFGVKEGRNPTSSFNTRDYLLRNPDVAAAGVNPFLHFVLFGQSEGRKGGAEPKTWEELDPGDYRNRPASLLNLESLPCIDIPAALANAQQWCTNAEPQVSIVIVNRNTTELTLECVRHIWANTENATYEIIIVDNGSDSQDTARLRKLGNGTRFLELETNRFFGEASNIAAERSAGKYICFLSNAVFVRSDWLNALVRELGKFSDIGAVGPIFLGPDGSLKGAGCKIDERGYRKWVCADALPDSPDCLVVDSLPASALLMEKSVFLQVGGFDLAYEPAHYEDADLCFKLRTMGLKTRCCRDAKVIYIEEYDTNSIPKEGGELENVSRLKFIERWASYLEHKSMSSSAEPRSRIRQRTSQKAKNCALPVGQTANARTVAVFTPFVLTPGGGERYILSMAMAVAGSTKVTLVTPNPYSQLRMRSIGRELDLDLSQCTAMTYSDFVNSPPRELMLTLGNHIFPPVEGHAESNWYHCQFPFPYGNDSRRPSCEVLAGYRGIIVNSEYTKQHTRRALDAYALSLPIEIIHPPVTIIKGEATQKKSMILHVGRFFVGDHSKRQDLMIGIFEILTRRYKGDIELHLAGSSIPEARHISFLNNLQKYAQHLPVKFHVNPTKGALWALYRDAAIYWHATGLQSNIEEEPEKAEHFGISVVEAMSAECVPLAYDAGGPREIINHGVNGFLYDTQDTLINLTIDLLQEPAAERRMQIARAAHISAMRYDTDRFVSDVLRVIG